jgi:tetratricopeptide (TPR) repeat protein
MREQDVRVPSHHDVGRQSTHARVAAPSRDCRIELPSRIMGAISRQASWPSFAAALMLIGAVPAVAQIRLPYERCGNVSMNPVDGMAACTAIIRSGREIGHNLAVAYLNRGLGWTRKDNLDNAIADFTLALAADPNYARAYFNRGQSLGKKGETDRALADLDKSIRLNPGLAAAYNSRGATYARRNDLERAFADFDQAIRLDPMLAPAFHNRGLVYRSRRDFDHAIADLSRAIQLDPQYVSAYSIRGLAWRDKDEFDRAIADFDSALRIDPRYVAALVNRALTFERTGRRDRALADFEAALAIDRNHAQASAGRVRLASAAPPVPLFHRDAAAQPPSRVALDSHPPVRPVLAAGSESPGTLPRQIASKDSLPPWPTFADALAACSRFVEDATRIAVEAKGGEHKVPFPSCYKGRRHLDCVVAALLDEAGAIDRDYGEILAANYPDLKDADSICRIDGRRIDDHLSRSKNFDVRVAALQKAFDSSTTCVEKVRGHVSKVDLNAMQNSGVLMKSILDNISGPVDRAAARHRAVLRLVQGISASQKAMATVRDVRALACP